MGIGFVGLTVLSAAVGSQYLANGITDLPLLHLREEWGYTRDDVPDLTGKNALVTGASSGLGLGVAKILTERGATLLVTARSEKKCKATLSAISKHLKALTEDWSLADQQAEAAKRAAPKPKCVVLELTSLDDVDKSAREIQGTMPMIDLYVANAGVMAPPKLERTLDGVELQFATNHLGHFHLTNQIKSSLTRAVGGSRLVVVSSIAHWFPTWFSFEPLLTKEALGDEEAYAALGGRWKWYGWSKLCNILWARELSRRIPQIHAQVVNPGTVRGNLMRHSGIPPALWAIVERWLYWDPLDAALTVLRPLLADDFGPGTEAGRYLVPIARERGASAQAADEELAMKLWMTSDWLVHRDHVLHSISARLTHDGGHFLP